MRRLVPLGLGGGEDHGLEADGVGAAEVLGPELAEQLQRLADRRRIGLLAGGQQGERHQAGRAGPGIALDVRPGAVLALLGLEEADPVADGPLHLLPRDAGPDGPGGIERDEEHQGRDAARGPRSSGREAWETPRGSHQPDFGHQTGVHHSSMTYRVGARQDGRNGRGPLLLEIGHDLGEVERASAASGSSDHGRLDRSGAGAGCLRRSRPAAGKARARPIATCRRPSPRRTRPAAARRRSSSGDRVRSPSPAATVGRPVRPSKSRTADRSRQVPRRLRSLTGRPGGGRRRGRWPRSGPLLDVAIRLAATSRTSRSTGPRRR